jgi:hypothetical protein
VDGDPSEGTPEAGVDVDDCESEPLPQPVASKAAAAASNTARLTLKAATGFVLCMRHGKAWRMFIAVLLGSMAWINRHTGS